MNRRSVALLALIVGLLVSASSFAADAPRTMTFDGADIARVKDQFKAGDKRVVDAVKSLVKQADKSLDEGPWSVMSKPFTPPSGDKHDYMSLSPYWWPDPSKKDGKPYMRKDGQVNPEREKYDQPTLDAMTEAVQNLSLAYYFTGDEKYAKKAAECIRVWYFDPATRMNPNVTYAQQVMGNPKVRGVGCIETNRMRNILDADGLLAGSSNWTADDHAKLQAWFKQFLDYLITSDQGHEERDAPNNHGTWYAVQTSLYAMYLGDNELAKQIVDQQGHARIKRQIEPDGKQPLEMERTKAYDYSRFNLEALCNLARFGEKLGLDLWHYKTDDGRSLRAALDWLAPYASGEKKWEGQQIVAAKTAEAARVFRWAANAYNEPNYEAVVDALKKTGGVGEKLDLMYPSKLK